MLSRGRESYTPNWSIHAHGLGALARIEIPDLDVPVEGATHKSFCTGADCQGSDPVGMLSQGQFPLQGLNICEVDGIVIATREEELRIL